MSFGRLQELGAEGATADVLERARVERGARERAEAACAAHEVDIARMQRELLQLGGEKSS